jgi:hypothetical protein
MGYRPKNLSTKRNRSFGSNPLALRAAPSGRENSMHVEDGYDPSPKVRGSEESGVRGTSTKLGDPETGGSALAALPNLDRS